MVPVGIKSINNNYVVLLVDLRSKNELFLKTVDTTGKIIDQMKLDEYQGLIVDSINQMAIYEMRELDYFTRKDTEVYTGYTAAIGDYTVRVERIDTFKYVNGKVVKKQRPHNSTYQ